MATLQTTDRKHFNCGGFALNTFDWFSFDWGKYSFGFFVATNAKEAHEKITRLSADLLSMFDDLRPIHSIQELNADEYAIAFRLSCDKYPDFHFLKRGQNGIWYEKRGHEEKIRIFPKKNLFARKWNDRYGYEIAFFAKKLPKSA